MFRLIGRIPDKKQIWKTEKFSQFKQYNTTNSQGCKTVRLPPARFYSNKEVCPPKKSSGHGTLYTLGALALIGGGTLGYAKYDPDFRKTLVEYAPFTDTLIKTMFQEENTLDKISEYCTKLSSSILGLVSSGKTTTVEDGKIVEMPSKPKSYKAPPIGAPAIEKDYNEIRLETKQKGQSEPKVKIVGDKKAIEGICDENVKELEEKICKSATDAVNAYNKAVFILKTYNQDISYIIDEAVNQVRPEHWESVRQKTKSKNECIKRAQAKAEEATKAVNKLKEVISRPSFTASADTKEAIRNNITRVQDDIAQAKKDLDKEMKNGHVTEKYWEKVENARQHFSEELETLFPSIDLSKKKMNISGEELDLFVLHTYANILFYQKELAKMETVIQEKVRAAEDAAKRGGGEPLTHAQICEALEQEKRRLTLCFQQQCLKLRKESEGELRDQLMRQSQAFSDHLNDAIKTKQLEIERCLSRKFDEQLEVERGHFKTQMAGIVGRLQGLDQALKAKADADDSSKRAQILWSSCQSLLRAIKAGCPGLPWKEQIRPLDPEINAVENAAGSKDELVAVVLKSIPKEAKERGVYPEDALRERFLKVERVARTVALVPEDGAPLPVHILSYIQSLLLVKAASPIPQAELNDESVDFSKLNTNDILQRARYWLDRGNFAQSLKYMNLLEGAPRCVARQWMNETRILLETQQAANTLMAHAASSGLMYL